MVRSLYTAATGMIAQQSNVDNISNNLANVNTVGYKEEKMEFKSLLYQTLQTKTTTANGEQKPIPAQAGLGTRVASNTSIFTQGPLLDSDSATDFAIAGDGFFAIRSWDGEIYYTRAGNFTWAMGTTGLTLTTPEGYPVLGTDGNPIVIPDGVQAEQVIVAQDGSIGYRTNDGTFVDLNQSFALYQFNNPAGLEKIGSNLLAETDASGNPLPEATTQNLVRSQVRQNYLEGSNVNVATEMVNLIVAQRAYQLNSKAITTSDEMLEQANNLKR